MEEDGVQGLALLAEEMNEDHLYNVIDQSVEDLSLSNNSEEEDIETDTNELDFSIDRCTDSC
eukprot:gene18754-24521_t